MRVFYDHQVFSLQDAGGAARYHYELIAHLLPHFDVQIEAFLGLQNSIYPFASLADPKVRITGMSSTLRPGAPRYAVNEALSNVFVSTRGTFDVYHPTLYRALPLVRRRRMVVTHHDCAHELYPQMFRNAPLVVRNKRKLYGRADAIICVSESSRRDLLHYYEVDSDRVFVVYHGFKPFQLSKETTAQTQPPKRPYVLFVGFRGTYKNFAMLLTAYARSGVARDYDLLTIGGGGFSLEEQSQIENLGVAQKVMNLRNIDDSRLSGIYRGASLFIYPSLHEGFGFPPLEAMSVGCPVLVSSTSSLPEICGDAANYFDPEDPDGLSRSMMRILGNQESLSQVSARGYAQVAKYDWNEAAAKTHQIYINVLNQ
jgi:glycosyltransferase involved in cell wall biosynthesis